MRYQRAAAQTLQYTEYNRPPPLRINAFEPIGVARSSSIDLHRARISISHTLKLRQHVQLSAPVNMLLTK